MKTIILAGGFGTRLGTITDTIPKPMVRIGDKPILWHIMKIYAHYGQKDFIVSLGYKGEVIKEYFYNFSNICSDFKINFKTNKIKILKRENPVDWKVTLVDTGWNSLKGARIKRLEKYLDDVNLLTYGDGVVDLDIRDLIKYHKSHGKLVTITGVRPPSRFGEILEKNGQLLSFQEKPQTSSGLINGGFIVFNKKLLNYLTPDENCDLEFGCFHELAAKNEMMVYKEAGAWECVDTERDLKHLNTLWTENKAFWKVWD